MKSRADKLLDTKPHRVKSMHETFSNTDAAVEKTSIWITEYIRPDREHNFYGLNESDPSKRYERIRIGDRIFTKRDGKWKRWEYSGGGLGLSSRADSVRYLAVGIDKLGDAEAKVYELISTHRFWIGNTEMLSVYRERYWVSADGRLLKTVGESDGVGSKRSRTTETYEYDPKIKIEIPIK